MPNGRTHYAAPSRWLHWLVAVLIFVAFPMGLVMSDMPQGPNQDQLFALHKSLGLTVLALVVLRILARGLWGAPKSYEGLTGFERMASTLVHGAMYMLILLVPLGGWVGTSMCCKPVLAFGALALSLPVEGSKPVVETIFALHGLGAKALMLIVLVHVAGGLYHWLIKRDGVMARMSLLGERTPSED